MGEIKTNVDKKSINYNSKEASNITKLTKTVLETETANFQKESKMVPKETLNLFFPEANPLEKPKFHENIKDVENPNNELVLVNKNNVLSSDYVPNDLVSISSSYAYDGKQVRENVKNAFENLAKAATESGHRIVVVSAYRSYDYQEDLYNLNVAEKGKEYADNYSARKGHSEHQTGLAIDVEGSNRDYMKFQESEEFKWMKANAHKYGFILRYPENKSDVTGFGFEAWHYRYVGTEAATEIYTKDITLEEYTQNY
jgi:D-alanyl-D-alanine carboxypeptidase